MKIAEKQQVIEVLLCTARSCATDCQTTSSIAEAIGNFNSNIHDLASDEWINAYFGGDHMRDHTNARRQSSHGEICLEAAYRLIESSPALRRHWFGAK